MMDEFAGTLTQQIQIEALNEDRTESGLTSSTWIPVFRCRSCVVPEGAGAEAEGMAFSGMPRMRFLVRRSLAVAVQQRVRWRGRFFMIRQVYEDPRQPERIELRCEEIRA